MICIFSDLSLLNLCTFVVSFRTRVIKAANNIEALLPPEARAPTVLPVTADSNQSIQQPEHRIKERTARRYRENGADKMLNHEALQTFVVGRKTALREELLKAMPAKFM